MHHPVGDAEKFATGITPAAAYGAAPIVWFRGAEAAGLAGAACARGGTVNGNGSCLNAGDRGGVAGLINGGGCIGRLGFTTAISAACSVLDAVPLNTSAAAITSWRGTFNAEHSAVIRADRQ
jgi:hypothetical protein